MQSKKAERYGHGQHLLYSHLAPPAKKSIFAGKAYKICKSANITHKFVSLKSKTGFKMVDKFSKFLSYMQILMRFYSISA
jgi:hypothetical protein